MTAILPQQNTNEKQILSVIDKFFKDFKTGVLLKQSNFCKEGGVPCLYVDSAKYAFFDSWFCFPGILLKIRGLGLHTIAMMKSMKTVKYSYQGKRPDLNSLYAAVRKKRGKAKILASVIVGIGKDENGNEVPAKVVLGRSYDCMAAHTTIVFSRYIMLALESRNNKDLRTWGELFHVCCDELHDIKFIEALQLIINLLKSVLVEKLLLTKQQIDVLLEHFIVSLPAYFKEKLAKLQWET